ncbi:hypothetical protein BTM25_24170 [Actinomadura rubteroloni]|uniref:Uncharacterized protein n=1 Tax=Actinomadura rubteroloni TaxID=1926885 RepID=A0A2P4UFI7_9ACTN|nr:hypothetical protein [Actinomadura rubteroloni]POM23792.1 hypothetical protein BTM25_24170 [Actinomadura rubteroloni]
MGRRKTTKRQRREERRFRVRGVRRDPPDMRKLGQALLSLAQAEAERQAQADHEAQQGEKRRDRHEADDAQAAPKEGRDG